MSERAWIWQGGREGGRDMGYGISWVGARDIWVRGLWVGVLWVRGLWVRGIWEQFLARMALLGCFSVGLGWVGASCMKWPGMGSGLDLLGRNYHHIIHQSWMGQASLAFWGREFHLALALAERHKL